MHEMTFHVADSVTAGSAEVLSLEQMIQFNPLC